MMTEYKTGQRVRIEWPNLMGKPLVEGEVQMRGADSKYACISVAGRYYWLAEEPETDITVLSEPRPEEPKGLGAVVEAACVHSAVRRIWLRDHDGNWESRADDNPDDWDSLIDPVVKTDGWTPMCTCGAIGKPKFHTAECALGPVLR